MILCKDCKFWRNPQELHWGVCMKIGDNERNTAYNPIQDSSDLAWITGKGYFTPSSEYGCVLGEPK